MNLPNPSLQGFIYSMGTSEDLECVKGVSYFKLTNEYGKGINACYAAMALKLGCEGGPTDICVFIS